MNASTPFMVGEHLVFTGGPGMAAKPGARVMVTRSLYVSAGGARLIGVAWIDALGTGMRRGGFDPTLFRRNATIIALPYRAGAARRLLERMPRAALVDATFEQTPETVGDDALKPGKLRVLQANAVEAGHTLAWEQLDLDFFPAAETLVPVVHVASEVKEAPPVKGAQE